MKLFFNKKLKIPMFMIDNACFPIWVYPKIRHMQKICNISIDCNALLFLCHEFDSFKYYLPPFSLKGKTILDIGACCGETAWFFLKSGAAKVICIEPNPLYIKHLYLNKRLLNIEVVPEKFNKNHLNIPHDMIKCDIEGYEMELLPYADYLKPTVLEAHNWWIVTQFEKIGFRNIATLNPLLGQCIMTNW